jgi:filamentous hemagglutinin
MTRRSEKGDGLDLDHIPSKAALIRAEEERLGRKLTPPERRKIEQSGICCAVPQPMHADGRTYRNKNTPEQVEQDAQDLAEAARKDMQAHISNAEKHGFSKWRVRWEMLKKQIMDDLGLLD